MLQIIYGSSISYKTEAIYDELLREAAQNPDGRYIMLVPEQASLTVQQELVQRAPGHGLLNVDILTFNRLAYQVFEALGESGGNIIDETGKLMLLRLVVEQVAPELRVLKRNLKKEGFLEELKSVISELVQYNVSPEKLAKSAEELDGHPLLQKKLRDIAVIYREFMELLHRDYSMAEERMIHLAGVLKKWPAIGDTIIAMDGFTGFTPPQYEVLRVLLQSCPKVILGATMGSGRLPEDHMNEEDLFHMSAHMTSEMKELAILCGAEIREITVDEEKSVSEAVRHLERALFVYPKKKLEEETEKVRILRAKNSRQEVEIVLSEILAAVRNGAEYRDLAVICGDPSAYRDEIETQFARAGVPCFIDATQPLIANPLFLLIENVLAVFENSFSHDQVVNFLKNPLMIAYYEQNDGGTDTLSTYERVCEVENYALSLGLRGKNAYSGEFFKTPAQTSESRLETINRTKSVLLESVFTLYEAMTGENLTVRDLLTGLTMFLEHVHAYETMLEMSHRYEESGELLLKREYEQAYELLMNLFTEMDRILGGKALSADEFSDVLKAGMGAMSLGMVPPTKDRVVIGDLKRTRLGDVKKLYVIGANEGVLPKRPSEGGLLSEIDREIMGENKLKLAPGAREESFNAQFYLYLMLTKPSDSLFITYAVTGADGKSQLPSYLIGNLQSLFTGLEPESITSEIALVNSEEAGYEYLAEDLRIFRENAGGAEKRTAALLLDRFTKKGEVAAECSKTAAVDGETAEENTAAIEKAKTAEDALALEQRLSAVMDGLFYRYNEETLLKETAEMLYRETISGSVTRLEHFAGCAFAHFMKYGLGLKERDEFEIDAADMGTLLHASIERFFSKARETNEVWYELTEERRREIAEAAAQEVAEEYNNDILKDSARNEYMIKRVARMADRTMWALTRQWEAGAFEKTEQEVHFTANDAPEILRMSLGDGLYLALNGQIDRMDTAEKDGRVYVKIIDYKSGRKELDLTKVFYGLQLQLPLYMEAAKALVKKDHPGVEIVPVGMYYYHIDDPIVAEKADIDPLETIYGELKMKGLTNADAYSMVDRRMTKSSEVVAGLSLKTDGSFAKGAKVAEPEQMEELSNYALKKSGELAKEIMGGKIAVDPYRYKTESGCDFCAFKSVCGFDPRVEGYKKTPLSERTIEDFKQEPDDGMDD